MSFPRIIKQTVQSWLKDGAPSMGAALAFYALFAIAPILLIVIWVASMFIGPDVVQAQVLDQVRELLGDSAIAAVRALLVSVKYSALNGYSTAIGVIAVMISASSVFAELQNALNRIWRAPPRDAAEGLKAAVRARLLSLALIVAMGVLLLLLVLAAATLQALGAWLAAYVSDWHQVMLILTAVFGLTLSTLLFALIYKYVPDEEFGWADVWVGALVTAALFAVGKLLVVSFLGKIARNSAYGLAGSFLVLLLWVYYSAQIFLLGAEFTCQFARSDGSRAGRTKPSAARVG